MRITLAILLAIASNTAFADFSYRFDRGVVTVGDSAGTLMSKGGKPDRIVEVQNANGAAVGERWEYYFQGKQVNFTLADGKVTDIQEIR
jgi:hypothetical protein